VFLFADSSIANFTSASFLYTPLECRFATVTHAVVSAIRLTSAPLPLSDVGSDNNIASQTVVQNLELLTTTLQSYFRSEIAIVCDDIGKQSAKGTQTQERVGAEPSH